jgi:hypothetical protein
MQRPCPHPGNWATTIAAMLRLQLERPPPGPCLCGIALQVADMDTGI